LHSHIVHYWKHDDGGGGGGGGGDGDDYDDFVVDSRTVSLNLRPAGVSCYSCAARRVTSKRLFARQHCYRVLLN
jgi:hypothetical protein